MKKGLFKLPIVGGVLTFALLCGALSNISPVILADASGLPQQGDTYGGCRVYFSKQAAASELKVLEVNVGGAGNADYSGTGIYMRIKNNTSTNTPINMKLNSTNQVLIGPTAQVPHTYYNASGVLVDPDVDDLENRDWGNYLRIPANFDGYIYMDYSTQMSKIQGRKDFDPAHIWRIYFDIDAHYDSYADFVIGDIFTDQKGVLDTSELESATFANTFIVQESSKEYLSIEQVSRTDEYQPKGDLLGSINVKAKDSGGGIHFLADGANLEDGVFVRLKNNSETKQYIKTHLNSRNGGRATNVPGALYYTYDSEGLNKQSATFNNQDGGQLEIPANFDGIVYLPVASYVNNTEWSTENVFNPSDCYAIYFEGVMENMDFGDIFTKTTRIFDGSSLYPDDYSLHFVVDWDVTYEINEGHLIPTEPEFEYGEVEYLSEIDGGVAISCLEDTENNTISYVSINFPTPYDFSSALAITLRVKAISGTYPYYLHIVDGDSHVSELPANGAEKKAKYVSLKGDVSNTRPGGNDHSIYYDANFDGNLIIPLDVLTAYNGESANLAKVVKIQIGIAVHYDFEFKAAFSDVGYITKADSAHHVALDCSAGNFADLFTISAGGDFVRIKKYHEPKTCSWIGDVKILNSLNYATTEDLKEEILWNSGDNACSYAKQDDGMFVHIGPFETGHQYGSYMCLQMPEKGVTTDRTIWSRTVDGEKQLAKGITMYVKNLSRKEIGITLQLDELTTENTYERWCIIGYPAMYYAWDVVTGAEYSFYCKSDQFQIPVGFEGYVRIPFTSYGVPDWCQSVKGVDNILDIEKWSGTFYLTSNNEIFEDLEYFIKNVGIYFNDTQKGSLFDQSHSIKTNMGL